jgi:hypothetical protein
MFLQSTIQLDINVILITYGRETEAKNAATDVFMAATPATIAVCCRSFRLPCIRIIVPKKVSSGC